MGHSKEHDDDDVEDPEEPSSGPASSAGTAAAKEWAIPLGAAGIIGSAVLVGVLFLALPGTSKTAYMQRDNSPASGGGGGPPPTTAPTTTSKPTTAPPRVVTTLKTTAKATTVTTTTTLTPMWKKSLICLYWETFNPDLVFPDDGLCDLNFFQALEQNHTFLKDKAGEHNAALDAFLALAAKQTKTEHGVGLDHSCHLKTAEVIKDPVSKETIKELWGKKIYHWGFLTTDVYKITDVNMTRLFKILKSLKTIVQQEIKPRRPNYFIFTGVLAASYGITLVAQYQRSIVWLDGIGILGHIVEDDRNWSSGRIMPPTFWVNLDMPDQAYRYYLRTAHNGIRHLRDQHHINGTAFYITVSMAAKRYIPDEKYAYRAEMLESKEQFWVPIMAYCKNTNYTFGFQSTEPVGPYYVSKKEERFISFDDSRSLGIKLCRGRKKMVDIRYGLIVYDTEMDDPKNQCGMGTYPRLKFLRRLIDFFLKNFTSPDAFEACQQLT